MPKVSIIVPVYNVERYLDRCIKSLIDQTLKDIEIILVDDESPDNCPALCDDYSRRDSRVKVIHKHNEGLGMACNSGLEIACGDYVALCDSDDFIDSDCYQNLYDTAITNKADAVFSGIKRIDQNGNVIPMDCPSKTTIYNEDEIDDFQLGMIAAPLASNQERERQMSAKIVLYSNKIIKNFGIKFVSERQYISEDLLFNLDFLKKCKRVVEHPKAYYYYFVNTSSLSQTLRKDRFEKYLFLRNHLLSSYSVGKSYYQFETRVNKMFIGYVRSAMKQIVHSSEAYSEKIRLIKEICDNSIWDKLKATLPIDQLPFSRRLIFMLTQKKFPRIIHIIFSLS